MATMPIEYTNRRGRKYFLHIGKTKTGKEKYFFSTRQEGELAHRIPNGYEIHETPNSLVSLRRIVEKEVTAGEVRAVEKELERHGRAGSCKVEVKGKAIVIFTPDNNPDKFKGLMQSFSPFRISGIEEYLERNQTYTPVMRFTLYDRQRRHFIAERFCFRGSVDDWIALSGPEAVGRLAKQFVKHVGKESFYNLC